MKTADKLNIIIVGTGYVGLTTGVALSYLGHLVTCVDNNEEIIEKLNRGEPTIYEQGLAGLLQEKGDNLSFTTELTKELPEAHIVIIAVGTPSKDNGDTNLCYVEEVAALLGATVEPESLPVLVNKSTVPLGTARRVETIVSHQLVERGHNVKVKVASNPEFLREGSALNDTFYPDRIVVGTEDVGALNLLRQMYAPILEQTFTAPKALPRPAGYQLPAFLTTNPTSAELIKYAANAFLATKISFINEIAALADKVGADISEVARGIGLDKRIGPGFLSAGVGWGGSCFPKDVRSLVFTAGQYGLKMPLVQAAQEVNISMRQKLIEKLQEALKVIRGSTVGVLGLSFKPNTDDIREAPAITIVSELLEMGARVKVYDPVAMEKYRLSYPEQEIIYCKSVEEAAKGSDALALLTDWDEFKRVRWQDIAPTMSQKIVVDGRNILERQALKAAGFVYVGIGRQ